MRKKLIRLNFLESISVIISIILFSYIIIPDYFKLNTNNRIIYLKSVADAVTNVVNKNYKNFEDPNILLTGAGRVNPGNSVTISKKLSNNKGLLIESKGEFFCVKLTSTGAVNYKVNYEKEC